MKKLMITAALLILCASLVSCSIVTVNKKQPEPADTSEPASLPEGLTRVEVDTDSMKKQAVAMLNSLDTVNLNSSNGFTVASTDQKVYVPDSNNSNYNAALIERNKMFEKKYSVEINQFYDSTDAMLEEAYQDMLAGIYYTDVFSIPQRDLGRFISKGVLLKTSSLPDIDFSAAYFDSAAMEQASAGFDCYAVYGEFNRDIDSYYCLYVNRELLARAGLSMPYDMVKNGTWTWDELIHMVRASAQINTDAAAIASSAMAELTAVCYKSSGANFIDTGYQKTPSVAYGNENTANVINLLRTLTQSGKSVYDATSESSSAVTDFMQGKALFCIATVGDMKKITTMQNDWCVLPLPKTDAGAETYYTYAGASHAVIACYAGAKNTDAVSAALCGLNAASSGGYLTAAYYYELIDTSIRDSSALDMMDYICGIKGGHAVNDFTDVYGDTHPALISDTKEALVQTLLNYSLDAYSVAQASQKDLGWRMSAAFPMIW